jgi:ATP-dependent Zn protease
MQSPNQKTPDEQPQTPQLRISPFWWILLIGLMVWNAITYFKSAPAQVEIPYSTFIDQVQAGNISSVTITGDEITGNFITSVPWPQVTPGPTPTGQPQAAKPQNYTEFITIFPGSVGDPNLLTLLEQKGVEIHPHPGLSPCLPMAYPCYFCLSSWAGWAGKP